jgi:hypothetical protein
MNSLLAKRTKAGSICCLLLCMLLPFAWARDKPAALQALEEGFEKDLSAQIRTLYKPYRAALSKLYDKKLKSGKLEDALAVKKEITRLDRAHSPSKAERAPVTAVAGSDGTFLLLPAHADLKGNIHYDQETKLLIGWDGSGSTRWPLDKVPQGNYTVTLNYHSGPFAGGNIQMSAGKAKKLIDIKGSGKWQVKKLIELGEITITETPGEFLLTILDARSQGVMELIRVTLTPRPTSPK